MPETEPNARRKILYLMHAVEIGGPEVCFLNFIAHVDRTQFQPIVVCPHEGDLVTRLRALQVEVRLLSVDKERRVLGMYNVVSPRVALQLVSLIRQEQIALLHSYFLYTRNYANLAAVMTRVPLVYTCHAWWWGAQMRNLQLRLCNAVPKAIIAVSHMIRDGLLQRGIIAPEKVKVIHPGVDLQRFSAGDSAPIRAEFQIPAHSPLVGIIARFDRVKDLSGFLRAAAIVARAFPQVRFLLVGDQVFWSDTDGSTVRQVMAELGLSQQVILTGYRHDVPQILASLDVLVSSSLIETFGLTLIEAMAAGKPVVATASGGPADIVVPGETGLLVPPGDPEALAQAIMALLKDREMAQTMGQAGRRRAERCFDVQVHTRKVEDLYNLYLRQDAGARFNMGMQATRCKVS